MHIGHKKYWWLIYDERPLWLTLGGASPGSLWAQLTLAVATVEHLPDVLAYAGKAAAARRLVQDPTRLNGDILHLGVLLVDIIQFHFPLTFGADKGAISHDPWTVRVSGREVWELGFIRTHNESIRVRRLVHKRSVLLLGSLCIRSAGRVTKNRRQSRWDCHTFDHATWDRGVFRLCDFGMLDAMRFGNSTLNLSSLAGISLLLCGQFSQPDFVVICNWVHRQWRLFHASTAPEGLALFELCFLDDRFLNGSFLNGSFLNGSSLDSGFLYGGFLHGGFLDSSSLYSGFLHGGFLDDRFLHGSFLCGSHRIDNDFEIKNVADGKLHSMGSTLGIVVGDKLFKEGSFISSQRVSMEELFVE
ncbi:hypothetical protein N7495_002183 [Penicillium taxi]|uniref:uncharacterized protein n=1 Tax=Penicillium taxi TaxID=168475 RepID=UPI002544D8EA|nr:uncharacterized protein N7495_002183 [Penicillium taxi]KAJ5901655.1 hypothetical protein N7495_002183 [Penicillium taxi]